MADETKDGQEEVVTEGEVSRQTEEAAENKGDADDVEERPAKNWAAEVARKNREIERLRAEHEEFKNRSTTTKNPNDLTTYADHELKAIVNSNDASVMPFKDQANDILIDRKLERVLEKERMTAKRATADMQLRTQYPDALNPDSEFAAKMDEVMYSLDLQKSPAGKLAAAEIVAARLGTGKSKQSASERKAEEARLADVKGRLVEGDRSRPARADNPKKTQDLEKRIMDGDHKAVGEVLASRGISADQFFGKK